jgi:hypothetical protein
MHRVAFTLLLLFVCTAIGEAQQQVRGQVVNRDGAAQQCQLAFYAGSEVVYRVTTDRQGYFYLNNPRYGTYRVVAVQGSRQGDFSRVTVDGSGLHPATLVVQW